MANYENWLTVIGTDRQLRRFDRIIRREMMQTLAQRQNPFKNAAECPYSFYLQHSNPQYKRYCFHTGYLTVAYIRGLSRRFPSLVFNLTFDIDRDVWDEGFVETGFEKNGDFTFKSGETICGYFTYEPIDRYPAWDYDPEPVTTQTNTKEAA